MFCHKCGCEISDDASFCQRCGAAVDRALIDELKQPNAEENGGENTLSRSASARSGSYVYGSGSSDNKNAGNTKSSSDTTAILGFIFSFLFSIVGLILSISAYRNEQTSKTYKKLALAGIIISAISLVINIVSSIFGQLSIFWWL